MLVDNRLKEMQEVKRILEDDQQVLRLIGRPNLVEMLIPFVQRQRSVKLRIEAINWFPHIASRKHQEVKETLEQIAAGSNAAVSEAAQAALDKMRLPRR